MTEEVVCDDPSHPTIMQQLIELSSIMWETAGQIESRMSPYLIQTGTFDVYEENDSLPRTPASGSPISGALEDALSEFHRVQKRLEGIRDRIDGSIHA